MRRAVRSVLFAFGVLAVSALAVEAGPVVRFDEWGNGSKTDGGRTTRLASSTAEDPLSRLSTLSYGIGAVSDGDVIVYKAGAGREASDISDVIRFIGGSIFVFSKPAAKGETASKADVSAADWATITNKDNWQVNNVAYAETNVPGGVGITWTPGPGPGKPGNFTDDDGNVVQYTFVSDSPEPSTLLGAVLGIAALAVVGGRRRASITSPSCSSRQRP